MYVNYIYVAEENDAMLIADFILMGATMIFQIGSGMLYFRNSN
jgi:hypothetical protein